LARARSATRSPPSPAALSRRPLPWRFPHRRARLRHRPLACCIARWRCSSAVPPPVSPCLKGRGQMAHPDGSVDIEARPFPLTIDPHTTAVIVVDMQQGFIGPGGWWDRWGVDVSGAQAVIAPIARVLRAARHAGIRVVYVIADLEHADERSRGNKRMAYYFAHYGSLSEPPFPREASPLTDSDIPPELAP